MARQTPLVVVSGLSGAGKSAALNSLEDLGYYCVDNLPPALIETFADLCDRAENPIRGAVVVVDVRARGFLDQFPGILESLREQRPDVRMVFLDADDATLQQRFSETRRPHPLAKDSDVLTGIRTERKRIEPIRELADRVVDTTAFTPHQLRDFMIERYADRDGTTLTVSVTSFAFRGGLPKNADLVFDVRFLPNPNYVADLKPLTGMDIAVAEFVESQAEAREFFNHIEGLLQYLMPLYGRDGRAYLTLAFGCTGGRHRSVAVASHVARSLEEMGHRVSLSHRDLPADR